MPSPQKPQLQLGRGSGVSDPIDVQLGARVRKLRIEHGFSQAELGARVGLSFQQIQKYERGKNRISVATLIRICGELEVSPGQMLEEIVEKIASGAAAEPVSLNAARAARALGTIRSDEVREAMFDLAKAIAAADV
jgi:transcriptional regulator with XRE-family HTH domain